MDRGQTAQQNSLPPSHSLFVSPDDVVLGEPTQPPCASVSFSMKAVLPLTSWAPCRIPFCLHCQSMSHEGISDPGCSPYKSLSVLRSRNNQSPCSRLANSLRLLCRPEPMLPFPVYGDTSCVPNFSFLVLLLCFFDLFWEHISITD